MTKRKKNQNLKRARQMVKGLIIRWEDSDPMIESSEVIPGAVTHSNPVLRMTARKVFEDFGDWICHHQRFRWLVTITGVFSYPNGQDQLESRELEAFARIDEINDVAEEQIRDIKNHGDSAMLKTFKFEIMCLAT